MGTVAAADMGGAFEGLLRRVASGEEIRVLQGDRVVARIVPDGPPFLTGEEAARRIEELVSGRSLGDVTLSELINEGRR